MKLYTILFVHHGPKSSEGGTFKYIVANSDEEVHAHVSQLADWDPYESECDDQCDEECECESYLPEAIIKRRGDIGYQDGLEDSYHGITKWGWTEGVSITDEEIVTLRKLGILES